MGEPFVTVAIIILIFWASILTVFVLRMIRHYNTLTHGMTATGLKDVLASVLEAHKKTSGSIKQVEEKLEELRRDGTFHFQKIGLVRFNPFADTGGSQSFTLAILDGNNNGLVITSLYARAGNRWYSKEVAKGLGKEYTLSKEEEAAIKKAQKSI